MTLRLVLGGIVAQAIPVTVVPKGTDSSGNLTLIILALIAIVPTLATLYTNSRQSKRADAAELRAEVRAAALAEKVALAAAASDEKQDKIYQKVDGNLSEIKTQLVATANKVAEVTDEAARLREKLHDPAQPMPVKTPPLVVGE